MIAGLTGKVVSIEIDSAVIDVSGVLYSVFFTLTDLGKLKQSMNLVTTVYTHLIHKEDSMLLYGFIEKSERTAFIQLLKVSGVGSKVAMKILSVYKSSEMMALISVGDPNAFKKIPGIGIKLAQKIIIDLKGTIRSPDISEYQRELIDAMCGLGYKSNDIEVILVKQTDLSGDYQTDIKSLLKEMSIK